MENLKWILDPETNEWVWQCQYCGAIYRQPQNWNPPAWCMKCRKEWY